MLIRKILLAILVISSIPSSIYAGKTKWDVSEYGAIGDGITIDTKAIQTAIDECHKAGGGTVYLTNGCFLSGTITMKSNVTLHIASGAKLLGSQQAEDYRNIQIQDPTTTEKYNLGKTLIYGENQENISIIGNGTIDGNGDKLVAGGLIRAHIIHFRACSRIKVENITLCNGSWWIQKYHSCYHLLINGVTVDSKENQNMDLPRYADTPGRNTDGCNIVDSRNVHISNCNIFSGDDGIVLKSFSKSESCSNVTINNCIISTNASGIKIGTETAGAFHDILVNNCVVYDTRLGGIELMVVDGAKMERVTVTNISMSNIKGTAIFVRLANRAREYQDSKQPVIGQLKDVLISNIMGTGIEKYGCTLTGIPQAPLEGIVLNNINLSFVGGNEPLYFENYPDKPVKVLTINDVPEEEKAYPRCDMFGKLPAYGFYIRHAKNIELNGIRLSFKKTEDRPAIIADDVIQLAISNLHAQGTLRTPSLIHLRNVRTGVVRNSICSDEVPIFLHLSGTKTENIQSKDNILKKSTQEIKKEL